MHQNLIRQYSWRDHYANSTADLPGDLQDSEVGARMHVDHCIEALRLTLMCHGDTTPYLIEVDPEAPVGARADFSAHHRCRKFDPLVEWMGEHSTPTHLGHH